MLQNFINFALSTAIYILTPNQKRLTSWIVAGPITKYVKFERNATKRSEIKVNKFHVIMVNRNTKQVVVFKK